MLLEPSPSILVSELGLRPVSWLTDTLAPLLEEGLLNYCGLSNTVPSMDYVRTIATLIARAKAS